MKNSVVPSNFISLAYDLDKWHNYGDKHPIITDISTSTNSHAVFCGMSGSGKSFWALEIFAKFILAETNQQGEFYFADYKGDNMFKFLDVCPRYYSYKNTIDALDAVYTRFNARLSGEDSTLTPITLFIDEYMAYVLALNNQDKKIAANVMNKVGEILLMGRSKAVRICIMSPRCDAIAFPVGSRQNFGIIGILGTAVPSTYEMLVPEFTKEIEGRNFEVGEGVLVLQNSKLHFIKVGIPRDVEKMRQICVKALS